MPYLYRNVTRQLLASAGFVVWLLAICCWPFIADARDLSTARQFFAEPVTIESASGSPPSATIRAEDGRILGYAFSTWDVSGSVGYSGRPIDIIAAVDPKGVLAGAHIVAHEEPILVIGIPREALAAYVASFKGVDVRAIADVRAVPGGVRAPQAVAGATVTSAVIRDALLRSTRAVLRARAAASETAGKPRLDRETLRSATWRDLVGEGALRRLVLSRGEAARLLFTAESEPEKVFIDLWMALATPPPIGESLLGKREYESAIGAFGPDDDLIIIAANGLYSFKGTEWRRSGIFDRIEIVQGDKTIRLREGDHRRIDRLQAYGSPEFREIGLFRISRSSGFDPTMPFRLDLMLVRDQTSGTPAVPAIVSLDYRIPDTYLIHPPTVRRTSEPEAPSTTKPGAPEKLSPTQQTDRAAEQRSDSAAHQVQAPLWQDIWWNRRFEVLGLVAMLALLGGILVFQDAVTARARLYYPLRTGFLIATLVFIGWIANAQLSVVNVITFVHALLSGFRWELFLLDPLVFILWCFVAVSMLFWGRGVFCGWLCPFGALQELANNIARKLGIRQVKVPFGLHERLWMIKYVLFLAILAVSLTSIMAAFAISEVEPFKTAITLKFMRDWPFVIYALALLAVGLFIERFFCRYLCPLGAALAVPARMRMFEWLKRHKECGNDCQICAKDCTVEAIHPLGQINPNECIYCLQCQANYYDKHLCPPLVRKEERRKLREANAARARSVDHVNVS